MGNHDAIYVYLLYLRYFDVEIGDGRAVHVLPVQIQSIDEVGSHRETILGWHRILPSVEVRVDA